MPENPSTHTNESEDTVNEVNTGNGKGIVVAAVVGAAVGAGVALLFAPCSGRETRAWLATRTREMKNQAADAIQQGKTSVMRAAKELTKDSTSVPSA